MMLNQNPNNSHSNLKIGTPTKNSTPAEALKNVCGLLGFLQHEV